MNKVDDIVGNGLCLGCGLCAGIDSKCKMSLYSDGFYYPEGLSDKQAKSISKICPGININVTSPSIRSTWGNVRQAFDAWSTDELIRRKAASGGVTTSLAIYLLESPKI